MRVPVIAAATLLSAGLLLGMAAHSITDINDTVGTMLAFPFSTENFSIGTWAYAATPGGKYLDARAYYSSFGFVMDALWLVILLLSWRVLTERYWREVIVPADPKVWAWMGRRLPQRALLAAYREAWVTVLPSRGEAFGLVLAESLACGTPVVGSSLGAIPEVVDRDEVGRLFDGDARELAGAILEALELAGDPATPAACLQKIRPVRGEGIDQPAGLKRLDAVHGIGRHDEAAAGPKRLGDAADRHLEAAFCDVARLDVRVGVRGAEGALLEGELDHHQLVRVEEDAPPVAVGSRHPFSPFPGRREDFRVHACSP